MEADADCRAFLDEHPEFAPGFNPNKRKRPRNTDGRRLTTYSVAPGSVDSYAPLYAPQETDVDEAARDGLTSFFAEAMCFVKPEQRQLLEWRYWEGLKQHEIAEKLGIMQPTVSHNLAAAHRALVDAIALFEGPLPVIRTGGRPKRDEAATQEQALQALVRRGLLPAPPLYARAPEHWHRQSLGS
ncbi:MAG: sigma factor-like helix-turn-helix DNA-binding protein [Actinomycetota bacterium]